MKKLKFLNGFVIGLIVIYSINFLANIYLELYPPDFMNFPDAHYEQFIFGRYTQIVSYATSIITFTGLFFIKNGLGVIIKKGIFNLKSATRFKTGGKLFLISGFLSLVFSLILLFRSEGEPLFISEIGQSFLLMVLGFSLYIVADILQDGNVLKQENELTI